MPDFNASNAECVIFTYKEGLLSAVAHDLRIQVNDFTVEIDEQKSVCATFNASSLRVVNAVHNGADNPGALSDGDKKKIEESIVKDVLHSSRFPKIEFRSESVEPGNGGFQIDGKLTLHGTTRSVPVNVREEDNRYVAEVALNQPDFGVKPFSAMFGTLKIKPEIKVRISLPRN